MSQSNLAHALLSVLVVQGLDEGDAFLASARTMLHDRFHIGHATLQVETGDDCAGC